MEVNITRLQILLQFWAPYQLLFAIYNRGLESSNEQNTENVLKQILILEIYTRVFT